MQLARVRVRTRARRAQLLSRRGGEAVVLARSTTSPDDLHGMIAARAIITETGGSTSHAAVVAVDPNRTPGVDYPVSKKLRYSDARALTHSDFDSWRSIATPQLSRDGKWLYFTSGANDVGRLGDVKHRDREVAYRCQGLKRCVAFLNPH